MDCNKNPENNTVRKQPRKIRKRNTWKDNGITLTLKVPYQIWPDTCGINLVAHCWSQLD
jgi:hypothetical protein